MLTGAPLRGRQGKGGGSSWLGREREKEGAQFVNITRVGARARGNGGAGSACGVAAQEGVKHGQLHALLIPPTPRHHRALTVGGVEVVAVARVRQAKGRREKIHQLKN